MRRNGLVVAEISGTASAEGGVVCDSLQPRLFPVPFFRTLYVEGKGKGKGKREGTERPPEHNPYALGALRHHDAHHDNLRTPRSGLLRRRGRLRDRALPSQRG